MCWKTRPETYCPIGDQSCSEIGSLISRPIFFAWKQATEPNSASAICLSNPTETCARGSPRSHTCTSQRIMVIFRALCQPDSSFTYLARKKGRRTLTDLVHLVDVDGPCGRHPATNSGRRCQLCLVLTWTAS